MGPPGKALVFQDFIDELRTLLVLLQASLPSGEAAVSVSEVKDVLDRLADGKLQVVGDRLTGCPVGTEVWASAHVVVQRSG